MPLSRRDFVRQIGAVIGTGALAKTGIELFAGSSAGALGPTLPAGTPILVMIELAGGNDILNTYIPHGHPVAGSYYRQARPQLAIRQINTARPYPAPTPGGSYLPPGLDLDGQFAFHGSLSFLANRWWDKRDVAVVAGTGEDVMKEMSHFAASAYRWSGAFTGPNLATGWLGRYNDAAHPGVPLGAISTSGLHQSQFGALSPAVAINSLDTFGWSVDNLPSRAEWLSSFVSMGDATTPASYNKVATAAKALADTNAAIAQVQGVPPPTQRAGGIAGQLLTIAALISAGVPCQNYVSIHGGFDTHGSQPWQHYTILQELDDALAAFFGVIDAGSRAGDVFVMITSEFGRQITQNGSMGCDHGRASATILVGGGVKGGAYGAMPDLAPAARYFDAMVPTVDFRSVWATVLNRLGGDPNLTDAAMGLDESGRRFADLGVFTTGPTTPPPTGGGGGGTTVPPPTEPTTSMATTSSMMTSTTMKPTSTTMSTTTSKPTTTVKRTTTTVKKTTTTTIKRTTTTVRKRRRRR